MDTFDALPEGEYVALIEDSETKETKKKNGEYLSLTLQIIEGEHEGRKLWVNLNLDNPNPKAVRFARSELADICRATNVMRPSDSLELHDIPMVVTVKCKRDKDTGEIYNKITGYAPYSAAGAAKPNTATAAATTSTGGAPPWQR